jgi:hypothetical protein
MAIVCIEVQSPESPDSETEQLSLSLHGKDFSAPFKPLPTIANDRKPSQTFPP